MVAGCQPRDGRSDRTMLAAAVEVAVARGGHGERLLRISKKISEQRRGWQLAAGGPAWPSCADERLLLLHVFGAVTTLTASVSAGSRALQASSAPFISRACDCVCRCSPAHAAHCLAGCGIT